MGNCFYHVPNLKFFSQALTWKNTLRDACVCYSSNWCLTMLLGLDKHLIDFRQMEQSWCFIFLISVCLPGTGSQLKSGGLCALRVLKYFVRNPKDEVTRRVYTTGKTGVCHSCSHGGCHFELHICFWGENIFLAWVDSGLQSLMLVSPFQMFSLGTSGYSLKIQSCTDSRQIWDGTN